MEVTRSFASGFSGSEFKNPHAAALLVDPDDGHRKARVELLTSQFEEVHCLSSAIALYGFRLPDSPIVVILSCDLGASDLSDLTEYVRHHWSHVRILILGDADQFLEDQLYDESVGPAATGEEILIAAQNCKNALSVCMHQEGNHHP